MIDEIEENETGASVRAKLNLIIGMLNQVSLSSSAIDPVAAPSGTVGLHTNTATGMIWMWDGAAWQPKV